ncbi:MAG: 4Fe-4S binding protein, partial [Candidatus Adiutrix sp.]|nr:4Fe-4S binding protein [Candidatus Adiutrix sp.]
LGLSEDRLLAVDPLDAAAVNEALDRSLAAPGPWVILAQKPCVLLPEFKAAHDGRRARVRTENCLGCRDCLSVGCPALAFSQDTAAIDPGLCLGCGYCLSVCRFEALEIQPGGPPCP